MARKKTLGVDEAPMVMLDLPDGEKCRHCGGPLHSGARGRRPLWRLDGPVIVISIVRRCARRDCPGWHEYRHPRAELDRLALRTGDFGLDVILRVGAMRILERKSVPEIHRALGEQYPELLISERQVTRLVDDYNALTAATLQSAKGLRGALGGRTSVTISLDGLQPDQGKEMLWLVRDLATGLPLATMTHPSVSHEEIAGLLRAVLARGLTIEGVVSDGQECVVKAVSEALPGVPHQVCQSHFLANVAKPLLAEDAALRKEIKKGRAASGPSSGRSKTTCAPLVPYPPSSHRSLRSLPKIPSRHRTTSRRPRRR
jgi:hypothetical protein